MKRVFKYTLPVLDSFTKDMPQDAQVLSLQWQQGDLQLWALVDDEAPIVQKKFRLYGTGHLVDDTENLKFVDTIQLMDGFLVFHLFEVE